jgi:hypothetical protein
MIGNGSDNVQFFTGQKSFNPAARTSRIEVHQTFTKRDLIILAPIYRKITFTAVCLSGYDTTCF